MTIASPCARLGPGLAVLLAMGCLARGPAFAQGTAQATPRGWSFFVRTQGYFESNPNFRAAPERRADFSGGGGGGLSYAHAAPWGNVSLTGDGGALFYRELTQLNTKTFSGGLVGNYRLGPRTELSFDGALASNYARRAQFLVDQGIVLDQTKVLTTRLGVVATRQLSTRSSLALTGRFEQAKFDSIVLQDGKTMGGSALFSRRVKPPTSLSLGYRFTQSESALQRRQIQTGTLGVRHEMGPRKDLSVNVGASSFKADNGAAQVAPYGAAIFNLSYQYLRLMFSLSHQVRQEFGLGRLRESDLASLSLSRTFGARRASFNAAMTYGKNRSTNAAFEDFRFTTYGGSAGLVLPLGRSLSADAGYSYFRSSQAVVPLQAHTVSVSLAYRFAPR